MSGVLGYLVLAAVPGVALLLRLVRGQRRISTAAYLVLTVFFLGLWLSTRSDPGAGGRVVSGMLLLAWVFGLVLAGFLMVNGVIMLGREWRRPRNAASLVAGLVIVALLTDVGTRIDGGGTGFRLSAVVAGCAVLVAGYLGFVFTAFLLCSVAYVRIPLRHRQVAIVVLGASVRGSVVRPVLAYRLDQAKSLWERETAAGRNPLLVVSGGQGDDEPEAESTVMARYLRERGVPDSVLVEEDRSTTTKENLQLSAKVLAGRGVSGRILVVTNNFHALRTAILCRRLGIPADVRGARTSATYLPFGFLREFVALLVQYPVVNAISAGTIAATLPLAVFAT